MRWLRGWRPLLRIAWRDARRSPSRSLLVVVMIALPVSAVTFIDVVVATTDISSDEAIGRRLGAADALVTIGSRRREVVQGVDPDLTGSSVSTPLQVRPRADTISELLDGPAPTTRYAGHWGRVETDSGLVSGRLLEVDLDDPLAAGLFTLTEGRLPERVGEVVVNEALQDRGVELQDVIRVRGGHAVTVVGVGRDSTSRVDPVVIGLDGMGEPDRRWTVGWLVGGGPVSWAEVRALNRAGLYVLSRSVVAEPPPASAVPAAARMTVDSMESQMATVMVLIVVMALLETVLLAGPAFAVGARRQSRTLALVASTGGTAAQARRVVLAGSVVLGTAAALVGGLVGIGAAWASLPVVQHFSGSWLGPFDVPWWHLAGFVCFAVASAVLAALVPAIVAARSDVVAVLAGRRGEPVPSRRSPILGVGLVAAGIFAAITGARMRDGSGVVAGSTIALVLGMILVVPTLLATMARWSASLPLPLRYATRDAARHRTRTVPAVAAVAATVVGVVALGTGVASDQAERRAEYRPILPEGMAVVTAPGRTDGDAVQSAAAARLPEGARFTPVSGVVQDYAHGTWYDAAFRLPRGHQVGSTSVLPAFGSSLLVGEDVLASDRLSAADSERIEHVLAAGGVVVSTDRPVSGTRVVVTVSTGRDDGQVSSRYRRVRMPAAFVELGDLPVQALAVFSPEAARRLALPTRSLGFLVSGADITPAQETAAADAMARISRSAGIYVERGYPEDEETLIVLLVLAAAAAVLMIGGTLTATFLSLSDARPDLATLAAVGAAPATRRRVAASYAVIIGSLGALLGAAVGIVPGLAAGYALTAWDPPPPGMPDRAYLAVPWALLSGIVIALPLLTAGIVALFSRSRLPMVARLT